MWSSVGLLMRGFMGLLRKGILVFCAAMIILIGLQRPYGRLFRFCENTYLSSTSP